MSDFNISNIPSSTLSNVGFRRKIDSATFNKNQEEYLNDILNLYNNINSTNKRMRALSKNIISENEYLKNKIKELELEVDKIKNKQSLSTSKSLNIPAAMCYTNSIKPSNICMTTNTISSPVVKSRNALNLINGGVGRAFVPNSLNISATSTTPNVSIAESNIKDALLSNAETVWVREIKTTNAISTADSIINITLSEDVLTSLDVNEIVIDAYPFGCVDIDKIEYKLSGDTWRDIPNIKYNSSYKGGKLKDVGAIKLVFPTIKANHIRIKMVQNKYITSGNYRLFHIGCKSISILNNLFSKEENFFNFDIDLPNKGCTIKSIIANHSNYESGNSLVNYEFYYTDENNVVHRITDSVPFIVPSDKVTVRCKLKNTNVNAVVSSFDIEYLATKY